jgi:Cu+-exporting ATPase
MIDLVKRAKWMPKIQLLADRISAVFVPVVIGIACICFLLNYFLLHDFSSSVMRSIAVLVIACPCAMGLATPAAIAVVSGVQRGWHSFRKADSLNCLKKLSRLSLIKPEHSLQVLSISGNIKYWIRV